MTEAVQDPTEQPVTVEQDPYGWCLDQVVKALDEATAHSGGMSEGEFSILQEIRRVIAEEDPGKVPHWDIPV